MKLRVLSLGAGVQSSTLALMAAHGEIDMPELAIFADVQVEPESVYKWLDWLETELPFPIVRVTAGNLAEKVLFIRKSKTGSHYFRSTPPAWILEANGAVQMLRRQCTTDFKILPIKKKLRELDGKKRGVEQMIGISLDEAQRMKPSRDKWIINRWPLIEKRMNRRQCLVWMKDHGYQEPPRSSCSFCPYHSNTEWKRLKTEEPEAFNFAVQWEKDFQVSVKKVETFRGIPFLHRSCVPLDTINFNEPSPQTDLFGNECEGLCGV